MNYFNYNLYDKSKIKYKKEYTINSTDIYSIKYNLNEIYIKSPKFTINYIHNNNYIDFNFYDIDNDKEQKEFYEFIIDFDNIFRSFKRPEYVFSNSIKYNEINIKLSNHISVYDLNKNIVPLSFINKSDTCILAIHIKFLWINNNSKIMGITYECDQIRLIKNTRPSLLDIEINDHSQCQSQSQNQNIPIPPPPKLPPPMFIDNKIKINKKPKTETTENLRNNGNLGNNKQDISKLMEEIKNGIKLKSVTLTSNSTFNQKNNDLINEIKMGINLKKTTHLHNEIKEFKSMCLHSVDEIIEIKNKLKKTSYV
jgi:hypothetical protein